jgi:hypothetical protein
MTNFLNIQFTHEDTNYLKDLIGIAVDLRRTLDMCDLIQNPTKSQSSGQQFGLMIDGFWTAALVSYFRCFGGGYRYREQP